MSELKWFRSGDLLMGYGMAEIVFTAKDKNEAIKKIIQYCKEEGDNYTFIEKEEKEYVEELDPEEIHEFNWAE